jgi:hypothetical protein
MAETGPFDYYRRTGKGEPSWDKVLFIVVNAINRTRHFAAILERMMGFEPTTFCMASRTRENHSRRRSTRNPAYRHGLRAA